MALRLGVITLFPEMFSALHSGISGRALERGLATLQYWNPRDWAKGTYRYVDDKPYGGGPGMVMQYEPLNAAIEEAKSAMPPLVKTVYLSPRGKKVVQSDIVRVAKEQQALLFIAGRYEGIDERVIEKHVDCEWSVGDFVLSGGELAAMVFIDAILRLLPGSLGDADSANQDSFMDGLLEHPQYTRPAQLDGLTVPPVLLSGDHLAIATWQRKQSLGLTWLKRPDLLAQCTLSDKDKQLLVDFKRECSDKS